MFIYAQKNVWKEIKLLGVVTSRDWLEPGGSKGVTFTFSLVDFWLFGFSVCLFVLFLQAMAILWFKNNNTKIIKLK